MFMETEASVKDDVDGDHMDYLAQDKANKLADELESTRESADELESVVCFMWKDDSELTVDEVAECFQAKSCKKVTSFPPALPKPGEVYMFVSDDSAKAGTIIRSYICVQIATHGVLIIIKGCA